MRIGLLLLGVAVLFMVSGAIPAEGDTQTVVFRTPLFVALMACIAGITTVCCVRRRIRLRSVPFLICHVGAVLILAGGFIRYLRGRDTQLAAPVSGTHAIAQLTLPNDDTVRLPFSIAVLDFDVQFYPPVYRLFRRQGPNGADDGVAGDAPVDLPVAGRDTVDLGELGTLAVDALRTAGGEWRQHYLLTDGSQLERLSPTPRHFAARLRFTDADGTTANRTVAVNHPVHHGGWWFYLQSYDPPTQRFVVLRVKRDPGRPMVIGGIWMLIVGCALTCWRRERAA